MATNYAVVINTDATNESAATHYYPAATGFDMGRSRFFSLSGSLLDADGVLTLTVEATNDSDTTNANWIQVYGYNDKNNATSNSWTVTNGTLTFAISFNNANYSSFRVKLVASGATNTIIIKGRAMTEMC